MEEENGENVVARKEYKQRRGREAANSGAESLVKVNVLGHTGDVKGVFQPAVHLPTPPEPLRQAGQVRPRNWTGIGGRQLPRWKGGDWHGRWSSGEVTKKLARWVGVWMSDGVG